MKNYYLIYKIVNDSYFNFKSIIFNFNYLFNILFRFNFNLIFNLKLIIFII